MEACCAIRYFPEVDSLQSEKVRFIFPTFWERINWCVQNAKASAVASPDWFSNQLMCENLSGLWPWGQEASHRAGQGRGKFWNKLRTFLSIFLHIFMSFNEIIWHVIYRLTTESLKKHIIHPCINFSYKLQFVEGIWLWGLCRMAIGLVEHPWIPFHKVSQNVEINSRLKCFSKLAQGLAIFSLSMVVVSTITFILSTVDELQEDKEGNIKYPNVAFTIELIAELQNVTDMADISV